MLFENMFIQLAKPGALAEHFTFRIASLDSSSSLFFHVCFIHFQRIFCARVCCRNRMVKISMHTSSSVFTQRPSGDKPIWCGLKNSAILMMNGIEICLSTLPSFQPAQAQCEYEYNKRFYVQRHRQHTNYALFFISLPLNRVILPLSEFPFYMASNGKHIIFKLHLMVRNIITSSCDVIVDHSGHRTSSTELALLAVVLLGVACLCVARCISILVIMARM